MEDVGCENQNQNRHFFSCSDNSCSFCRKGITEERKEMESIVTAARFNQHRSEIVELPSNDRSTKRK